MKAFRSILLLSCLRITSANNGSIPLCVEGTSPEAALPLCKTCSTVEIESFNTKHGTNCCVSCNHDECNNGLYSLQFDADLAWSATSLIVTSSNEDSSFDPVKAIISGSNDDGETWTEVASEDLSWSSRSEAKTVSFVNPAMHTSHKVSFQGSTGKAMYIGDVKYASGYLEACRIDSNKVVFQPSTVTPATKQAIARISNMGSNYMISFSLNLRNIGSSNPHLLDFVDQNNNGNNKPVGMYGEKHPSMDLHGNKMRVSQRLLAQDDSLKSLLSKIAVPLYEYIDVRYTQVCNTMASALTSDSRKLAQEVYNTPNLPASEHVRQLDHDQKRYTHYGGDIVGDEATCKVPEAEGSVFSITKGDTDELLARYQFDAVIDGDTMTIGAIDLCLGPEIIDRDATESISYGFSEVYFEPSLLSSAPTRSPTDAPTHSPTDYIEKNGCTTTLYFGNDLQGEFSVDHGPKLPPPSNIRVWSGFNNNPAAATLKNVVFTPFKGRGEWLYLRGRGSQKTNAIVKAVNFGAVKKGSIVVRVCEGCIDSHRFIYYKRLTTEGSMSMFALFTHNWKSKPAGGSNVLGTDFKLYSSFWELQHDENAWSYCNYDGKVGFPRDCGPHGAVGGQWNDLYSGQPDWAFFLYTESL